MSGSRAMRALTSGFGLLLVAMVAVATGVVAVGQLQRKIGVGAESGVVLSARLVTSVTVHRNLQVDAAGLPHLLFAGRKDIDADVAELRKRNALVGLEMWLPDGHLLYADPGHPRGETVLPAAERAKARSGRPFVIHNDDGSRGQNTVDVFLPVDTSGDGNVDVVVETLFPRDPINDAIVRSTRELYAGTAVAALLVAAGLWQLRRRRLVSDYAASHDPLTGLGNRTLLARRAAQLLAAEREGSTALMLIDMDNFKEVNEVLGHHAGNELLVAIGSALRECCRNTDAVVRLSGDQFAILMDGLRTPDSATRAAAHVLAKLRQPVVIGGVAVEADASIGVALSPQHGDELGLLLSRADVAMYQAKRHGSDVAVYDPDTDPRETQQLTLLAELRRAIPNGELELYYQPKCTAGGEVSEVEALIRWNHPERGLLPPAVFLPPAERTTVIKQLTTWVLQQAAEQCAAWRALGLDLRVAVNVSPRNLADDDLPTIVLESAARAGIPVCSLRIEITETAIMADPAQAKRVLDRLREMGVFIAIDDFGAGFTSLSYLKTLPAQGLKIDRQFITDLLDNPADEAVVGNVINLAHALGMSSVAEGVETPELWAKLSELGCDEIQGYVLTRPLPAGRIVEWLNGWSGTVRRLVPAGSGARGARPPIPSPGPPSA
jgi:diguanylate cyclase (GGDEF)-like protein